MPSFRGLTYSYLNDIFPQFPRGNVVDTGGLWRNRDLHGCARSLCRTITSRGEGGSGDTKLSSRLVIATE